VLATPALAGVRQHGAHAKSAAKHTKRGAKHHRRTVGRVRRTRASLRGDFGAPGKRPVKGSPVTNPLPGADDRPTGEAAVNGPEPAFGAFTDEAPYNGSVAAVDTLQTTLGRHIDIVNWYQSWGGGEWVSQVQPGVVGAVTDSQRTPLLTWEPWKPGAGPEQSRFSLRHIVAGEFDDYMGAWADGLRDLGADVYLRPMHEMNGDWYPWGGSVNGNSPELFVQAWRHMHDVFVAHGATNVRFVWSPMPVSVPDTAANQLERYYPGPEYVDVLALDGYNWGSGHPEWGGWQSFAQVFKAGYDRLVSVGSQPIWFAEVGSSAVGGDKAAWVRDMWATARGWSQLKALVWFDQNKEEDWRAAPVASAFATP
jgi:beta-mannanase